jgi:hypothetical protein
MGGVMAEATTRFRFVGGHTDHLSDGTALEPGAFYDLPPSTFLDEHNKDLLTREVLLEVPAEEAQTGNPARSSTSKAKQKEGDS